jgi:hypothetical protein
MENVKQENQFPQKSLNPILNNKENRKKAKLPLNESTVLPVSKGTSRSIAITEAQSKVLASARGMGQNHVNKQISRIVTGEVATTNRREFGRELTTNANDVKRKEKKAGAPPIPKSIMDEMKGKRGLIDNSVINLAQDSARDKTERGSLKEKSVIQKPAKMHDVPKYTEEEL